MSQSYKQCGTCHQYLDLSLFTDHPKTKDGKQSSCKSCLYINNANWKTAKKFENHSTQEKVGTLYLLTNSMHEGWVRVGQSGSGLRNRLSVHRSSTPLPETINYLRKYETQYSKHMEAVLIHILDKHPQTQDRRNDWFKINESTILELFDEVTTNEEASLRHRNEQPTQSHLALCN